MFKAKANVCVRFFVRECANEVVEVSSVELLPDHIAQARPYAPVSAWVDLRRFIPDALQSALAVGWG